MKITLKEILFVVVITGIFLSLSSYKIAKKAHITKWATENSRELITDTIPAKKLHGSSFTASDSSHNHTGNKALAHPKKKTAKNSHTTQQDKVSK